MNGNSAEDRGSGLGWVVADAWTITRRTPLHWARQRGVFVLGLLSPVFTGTIAEWNPVSLTITATRELIGNPGVPQDGSWIAAHAQIMAVVWPLVLATVFLPLAVRRFCNLGC